MGFEIIEWENKEAYRPDYNAPPTSPITALLNMHTDIKDEDELSGQAAKVRKLGNEQAQVTVSGESDKLDAIHSAFGPSKHKLVTCRWGLIPSFAKSLKYLPTMHNARSETINSKPIFKRLMKTQRCVVFLNGFYEWKDKVPYYVCRDDDQLMCVAGVYDVWKDPENGLITSVSLVTRSSLCIEQYAWLHDRIPLILDSPLNIEVWMTSTASAESVLEEMLNVDCPKLRIIPVSSNVNKVTFKGKQCLDPRSEFKGPMDKFIKVKNQ